MRGKSWEQVKVQKSTLIVAGMGDFAFDMLRYDACFPSREVDSYGISREHELRLVQLDRRAAASGAPTVARWRSFGWRVLWWGVELEIPEELRAALGGTSRVDAATVKALIDRYKGL